MSVSCHFYRFFIDPLLKHLRKDLAEMIPHGSSVIELGSGTGTQSLLFSETCSRVVGVDINSAMASCASSRLKPGIHDHISFIHGDGRNLHFADAHEFDIAAISLALHEMPEEYRLPILLEMSRTAERLIIADYSSPLPNNMQGKGAFIIERLAAGDHYRGFRNYQRNGGLEQLIEAAGLKVLQTKMSLKGVITLADCLGNSSANPSAAAEKAQKSEQDTTS
ncbi:MAG: class I SAM-dependent methyltransferase [Spirochaetales bacterium]|nr:class I SAM-dependent methyltransferase [Spirochaetales bacterium]